MFHRARSQFISQNLHQAQPHMKKALRSAGTRFAILLALLPVLSLSAATVTWNGPATTNTANNWSTSGNWSGGTPDGNDVKFYDTGAIPGISNINNTVDANTTINSLQFGNTNRSELMVVLAST